MPRSCKLIFLIFEIFLIIFLSFRFQKASRALTTTSAKKDIDSAAKFIGAGAATVGVAGSGAGKCCLPYSNIQFHLNMFFHLNLSSLYYFLYRNWFSIWFLDCWLCKKSLFETTTFLLRHFGLCFVWSHGFVLSYDGLFAPVCVLEAMCVII